MAEGDTLSVGGTNSRPAILPNLDTIGAKPTKTDASIAHVEERVLPPVSQPPSSTPVQPNVTTTLSGQPAHTAASTSEVVEHTTPLASVIHTAAARQPRVRSLQDRVTQDLYEQLDKVFTERSIAKTPRDEEIRPELALIKHTFFSNNDGGFADALPILRKKLINKSADLEEIYRTGAKDPYFRFDTASGKFQVVKAQQDIIETTNELRISLIPANRGDFETCLGEEIAKRHMTSMKENFADLAAKVNELESDVPVFAGKLVSTINSDCNKLSSNPSELKEYKSEIRKHLEALLKGRTKRELQGLEGLQQLKETL